MPRISGENNERRTQPGAWCIPVMDRSEQSHVNGVQRVPLREAGIALHLKHRQRFGVGFRRRRRGLRMIQPLRGKPGRCFLHLFNSQQTHDQRKKQTNQISKGSLLTIQPRRHRYTVSHLILMVRTRWRERQARLTDLLVVGACTDRTLARNRWPFASEILPVRMLPHRCRLHLSLT